MDRTTKFPDTDVFQFFNANPKNRLTDDCWARAISAGTGIDYKVVVMEMATMMCETGYAMNSTKLIDKYLTAKGFTKFRQPRKPDGTKYTGAEFCKAVKAGKIIAKGNIIANIGGGHIAAIVDCKVCDIWDCTYKCIGNYWAR